MFIYYVTLTKGQRTMFKEFLRGESIENTIDEKFLNDILQTVHLYRIFYEAGDYQTCKTIERKFADKEVVLPGTLSLNNIEDLTTLLSYSSFKNWNWLNLNSCHVQDNGVQILWHNLRHSEITIEDLWLGNNDLSSLSDSFLSEIIITCKVKILSIGSNKNVGETQHFFTTILTDPLSVIEGLYMSNNSYSTSSWAMHRVIFFTYGKQDSKGIINMG